MSWLCDPNFNVTRSAEKFRNSNAGSEKFDLSHEKLDRSDGMLDATTRNKTGVGTSQTGAMTSMIEIQNVAIIK